MVGKVVRKNKKGFGFIEREGGDVFFHASAMVKEPGWDWNSLQEGDEVEYELGQGEKGPRAEEVRRA
jgi:CspA family cold shock protein